MKKYYRLISPSVNIMPRSLNNFAIFFLYYFLISAYVVIQGNKTLYILQFILVISIVLWFMQILFAFVTREPWRCYILFKYLTSKQSVKTSAHTHKYYVLSMYKISSCNNNGLKKVKQFLHNTINADVYRKTFTYNGTLM